MTKDQSRPPSVPRTEPNQKQQPAAASSEAELDAFLGSVACVRSGISGWVIGS